MFPLGRREETLSTLRKLVGTKNEPLVDRICSECAVGDVLMLRLFERISDLVTDWYTGYLLREVKNAADYEEAIPPASLLAFSLRLNCIERLGELLWSRNPLSVLVAIETLSDVVALGPQGMQRSQAAYYLSASGIPLAMQELDDAIAFSKHCRPNDPAPYVPNIPLVALPFPCPIPCSAFYSVPRR
jgi:hypothetical protein